MMNIVPAPKKTTFFQREYMYNGETVRTSLDILLGEEEYILEVTAEDGITIIGGSEKAVFYGECTLEQILTQNKNNEFPKRQIESNQKFGQKIEKMVKNTPTTTNISDNVSISYETINSNKKYNAGIKQNINKINIKEQKNDIYIPYSTILRIES